MALQTIKGGLWIPHPVMSSGAGTIVMDASAEKIAYVFKAPKTGTLDKFEFLLAGVTFNAASVLRTSFQDVDVTTGDPDGTQDQFRDMTTLTANAWNVPGLITSDGTDGGSKRSVTRGDWIACVLEYQTFTAADSIAAQLFGLVIVPNQQCYADLFTASWAKQTRIIAMALKYNDGTYDFISPNAWPQSTTVFTSTSFNSGSTPDERGIIFQLPFPFKMDSAWVFCDIDAVADLVLYDSDGSTALETVSLDPDIRSATIVGPYHVLFSADRSLLANTNYRLVLKPTSVTNIALLNFTVNAAALMDAFEGGQNMHHTQRTDAGAWTETTTQRPCMGLHVTALDDGVSTGAGDAGGLIVSGSGEAPRVSVWG